MRSRAEDYYRRGLEAQQCAAQAAAEPRIKKAFEQVADNCLRLLSNCNCWSNSAVRNTAVPRQKNLNRPPRNCGRCRRLGRPSSRSFTSNWPREKGPAFVGGAKEIVMQRGRLGGIPLPRTNPNSGRWNWFHDGRPPAVIPGKGGNGLAVPDVAIARGCTPYPSSPRGAIPARRS